MVGGLLTETSNIGSLCLGIINEFLIIAQDVREDLNKTDNTSVPRDALLFASS